MNAAANAEAIAYVRNKLRWMRSQQIWPNGLRYLWTDAFGVVLLVSLFEELGERPFLDDAEWLVADVNRVLGRPLGIRIGEEPDRDGQYFHYLAMWLFALAMLGRHIPDYKQLGIDLARQIHEPFLVRGRGVIWKMQEDLSGPYPGVGFGAMDAYDGYVSYRMLDDDALSSEIADMQTLIDEYNPTLNITQDLGIGMMLWLTHFFPTEEWAKLQKQRCLETLDSMWNSAGYFCREPYLPDTRFAFTNFGVSVGLQAVCKMPERVRQLNEYFESYRSGDEYDQAAITHVMECSSHLPGCLINQTTRESHN
ncbi:MAG: hypothetical protein DRR11_02095 [Gammaproteobacteria bacterium]|nr:MAG: hypothetical protein DRR11_02095 [Gammaproteobacteria bacterium]RLA36808.1 MAG: hypothetical protein DRR15_03850 [Gammaproteobacteria bacterium]